MTTLDSFQQAVEQAEEAYEFMISFAGQGVGRKEQQPEDSDQIRHFLRQLKTALTEGCGHAARIPEDHDIHGEEEYILFVDQLQTEIETAILALDLLCAQEKITSSQVDDLNGLVSFQSIIMKLFFIDDLTEHLGYEQQKAEI